MFKEQFPLKIHVAFYPYTYVRVMAMKGKLYKKQDYDKLLKMQANEIAKYLEESDYKTDIHALGKELSGYTLVEAAIHANFVRHIRHLQQISSPEMNLLLRAYLKQYDISNLKTVLRAKAAGQQKEVIAHLLVPLGIFTQERLLEFFSLDSVQRILLATGFSEKEFHAALQYYEKEHSLLEIENFLDQQYYSFLFEFFQHLSGEHTLFKEFLQQHIDVLNIRLLLRLKKQMLDPEKISAFFFSGGKFFSLATLRAFSRRDFASLVTVLKKTTFKTLVIRHAEELAREDITAFETALNVWLLRQSTLLLHQFPLSVDTLLGYMFAKEIEIRNLRTLVKGKQLGFAEAFLAQHLVIER